MSAARTLRAYVELARLSNLPTCASNVLVGAALGHGPGPLPWWPTAGLIAAIMLLYVMGMALNDVLDVEVDRAERPARPLPSGRVSREGAMRFLWICGTGGLGIIAVIGVAPFGLGLALVVAIAAYDALHRRSGWSALLMGACRGLVYLVAAAALVWPIDWARAGVLGGALALYVTALTVVAAVEARSAPGRRGRLALLLPVIAIAPMLVLRPATWLPSAIAALILVGWLVSVAIRLRSRPARIGPAVAGWIAAICLVDGLYLALLDQPALAAVCLACFLLTLWAQRRVPGT